jgi:transposase-like protein
VGLAWPCSQRFTVPKAALTSPYDRVYGAGVSTDEKDSKLLTVPELAKELGISAQTVRRWVRRALMKSTRSVEGWPMVRLSDVPPELLEKTKKLSSARYRPATRRSGAETSADHAAAELAFYRTQLAKALDIIERLTGGSGDHPLNTIPEP